MDRVRLQIPTNEIFSTQVRINITDINYGNHLGNDSLVGILHEARVRWLLSLGLGELNVGGCGLIMADLAVEYKLECFYGDELNIVLSIGGLSGVGFELFYCLINQNSKLVANAKTGMVCYDYEQKKTTSIPASFRTHLLNDSV